MTKELKEFDTSAPMWMSSAGLPRDTGNRLVSTIVKVAQQTHRMTEGELETYRQIQLVTLKRAHGEKLRERLRAADDMIDQLELQRPGLKEARAALAKMR